MFPAISGSHRYPGVYSLHEVWKSCSRGNLGTLRIAHLILTRYEFHVRVFFLLIAHGLSVIR
jgi:hypothetical protein